MASMVGPLIVPDEVLSLILSFCALPTLLPASAVCKVFRRVIATALDWDLILHIHGWLPTSPDTNGYSPKNEAMVCFCGRRKLQQLKSLRDNSYIITPSRTLKQDPIDYFDPKSIELGIHDFEQKNKIILPNLLRDFVRIMTSFPLIRSLHFWEVDHDQNILLLSQDLGWNLTTSQLWKKNDHFDFQSQFSHDFMDFLERSLMSLISGEGAQSHAVKIH